MKPIEELQLKDFETRLGERFTLNGTPAVLKSAEAGKAGHARFRAPFSLLFEAEIALPDTTGVVALDHEKLGTLELLVQRITVEDDPDARPTYQVILN
jgi:hypothetical protein